MEKALNDYLEKIEKTLKPFPISERVDIIVEIKSEILKLQSAGKNAEEIIEQLGNPKDLAKTYMRDPIPKYNSFGWNRFFLICIYYSLSFLSGLIVIPTLAITAPVLMTCGIVSPILMAVKLVDYIFNLSFPYIENMGVFIGIMELNPIAEFGWSIVIGVLCYLAGRGCWKLLVSYIQGVRKAKRYLSI